MTYVRLSAGPLHHMWKATPRVASAVKQVVVSCICDVAFCILVCLVMNLFCWKEERNLSCNLTQWNLMTQLKLYFYYFLTLSLYLHPLFLKKKKRFTSILASINLNLLLRSAHNLSMMADKEYNILCPHFIWGELINETKTHHIECWHGTFEEFKHQARKSNAMVW